MERSWERSAPFVELDDAAIERIVAGALPGERLRSAQRLGGGLANSNYRLDLAGRREPVVLRLYTRDPEACGREAAVLSAVNPAVPAPRLLYRDESRALCGHPFVIERWIEGAPLYELLEARPDLLAAAGRELGRIAALIGGSASFKEPGFFAPDEPLRVSGGLPPLDAYIDDCLSTQVAAERLGEELAAELRRFVAANEAYLRLEGDAVLVHGDYKPSNIFVDIETGSVTAVLDWEYAFAGPPWYDLATLLRGSDSLSPEFEESVVTGFTDGGGELPRDWKRRVRLTDFANLGGFIAAPGDAPERSREVRTLMENSLAHWGDYPA